MPLERLTDQQEEEALRHSLQSYEESVLTLENKKSKILAVKLDNEWWLYEYPREFSENNLAALVKYLINVNRLKNILRKEGRGGIYFSLDPLIYGRKYWLDTVCHEELSRFESAREEMDLSLFILPEVSPGKIKQIARNLRQGDRPGWLGQELGILSPFTSSEEAQKIVARLKKKLSFGGVKIWEAGQHFVNLHEMKNRVKKNID